MKCLCLHQKLGDKVLSRTSLPWAVIGEDSGQFSSGFFETVCIGNLRALFLFAACLKEDILPGDFTGLWAPLSYLPVPEEVLEYLERSLSTTDRIPEGPARRGRFDGRSFNHEIALQLLLKQEQLSPRMELRKLLGLHATDSSFQEIRDLPVEEVWLNQSQLSSLVQVFEALDQSRPKAKREELLFTRHPLNQYGIEFGGGLYYEHSGYGVHAFFLPDVRTVFLFSYEGDFSTVFYAFLKVLHDVDYLKTLPAKYLDVLAQSFVKNSFVSLELISLDSQG